MALRLGLPPPSFFFFSLPCPSPSTLRFFFGPSSSTTMAVTFPGAAVHEVILLPLEPKAWSTFDVPVYTREVEGQTWRRWMGCRILVGGGGGEILDAPVRLDTCT